MSNLLLASVVLELLKVWMLVADANV